MESRRSAHLESTAPQGGQDWGAFTRGAAAGLVLLLATVGGQAQGIRGSKHDLSSDSAWWGGGDPNTTSQVCMYCHTPHHPNSSLSDLNAPLWNRAIDRTKIYTTYTSPTLAGSPGNPTQTVSVLCLGCHDGSTARAVANGISYSDKHSVINGPRFPAPPQYFGNCASCHSGGMGPAKPTMMLGPDLSNDHPIAISYPTGLGSRFKTPPDAQRGWSDARLFSGKVECQSCHQVHDPSIPPFLRKSNAGSALCLTCHVK
jgi:predicted CXXCH cytochrome family protein